MRRVRRTRRALAQKLNREPTLEEVAAENGIAPERVNELLELVDDAVSLDAPVGDGESMVADLVEDTTSEGPDATTATRLCSLELARALRELSPRLRSVLELRYGLNGQRARTLEEVGSELGVTRERVRQLEIRALTELRSLAPGLEHYVRV